MTIEVNKIIVAFNTSKFNQIPKVLIRCELTLTKIFTYDYVFLYLLIFIKLIMII